MTYLVIGGDWFDSTRPSSLDLYHSFRFRERCFKSMIINGNHDNVEPPFMSLTDEYGDLEDTGMSAGLDPVKMFQIGRSDAGITGLGWTMDREKLLSALSDMRKLMVAEAYKMNYVVLHAGVKELLGFDGAYQLTCQDLAEAFAGLEVGILVGHVHTRKKIPLSYSTWLYSPGSLYPLSSDKMGDSFTVPLITAETGEIEEIDCNVRHYISLKASRMCHPEGVMWVPPDIPEPDGRDYVLPTFVRVELDVPGFKMPRSDKYVVQYVGTEGQDDASEVEASDDEYGIGDAIMEELSSDEEMGRMAVKLATCDDPVAELKSWLDFWEVESMVIK